MTNSCSHNNYNQDLCKYLPILLALALMLLLMCNCRTVKRADKSETITVVPAVTPAENLNELGGQPIIKMLGYWGRNDRGEREKLYVNYDTDIAQYLIKTLPNDSCKLFQWNSTDRDNSMFQIWRLNSKCKQLNIDSLKRVYNF